MKNARVVETENSPQKSKQKSKQKSLSTSENTDIDPLSMMLTESCGDPLTSMMSNMDIKSSKPMLERASIHRGSIKKWDEKSAEILKSCTLTGKIRFNVNIMDDSDAQTAGEEVGVSLEKARHRLEELEKRAKSSALTEEYSQTEYVDMIDELKIQIREAWEGNERVNSLKRAIQCAKMLGSTNVPQFYPSMFVLISGVLDSFGDLVFTRMKARSEEDDFTHEDVCLEAKETCRNWFYKIACIRELLPRVYIEMALRCYRFLTSDKDYLAIITRISHILRGIGDPMVALYARVYLSRVAHSQQLDRSDPTISSIDDYIFSIGEFKQKKIQNIAKSAGITFDEFMYSHGLEMLLHYSAEFMTKKQFSTIMKRYSTISGESSVLVPIIRGMPPKFMDLNAMKFVHLIKESKMCDRDERKVDEAYPFDTSHVRFLDHPPPKDLRIPVLNEAWKVIKSEKSFARYTYTYMAVLVEHYSEREVLILLKDLVKHANQVENKDIEDNLEAIESTVESVVKNASDFGMILTSEHFMAVMDLFKSDKKTTLCKSMLTHFCTTSGTTSDPVVIHTVFDLARNLHDSVDLLSTVEERETMANLICKFMEKVDFGRDLEQQLNVYVDCRSGFANLDSVNVYVFKIEIFTYLFFRTKFRRHNRKTAAFTKACLAYCHVTIPTIDSFALINQCLPQMETMLKEAINLIGDAPAIDYIPNYSRLGTKQNTEGWMISYISSLLSLLVVIPGNPDPKKGAFFIFKGLLKAVQKYPWVLSQGGKTDVYVFISISIFFFVRNFRLPYHVPGVSSNDVLYGTSDREYIKQANIYINDLFDDVCREQLPKLIVGGQEEKLTKIGMRMAISLLNQILASVDITPKTAKYATKLLKLVAKNKTDPETSEYIYFANTVEYLHKMSTVAEREKSTTVKEIISLHLSAVSCLDETKRK
eukprot:GSMAST32.ASY1.ANO1.2573.1 assembled CDS